MSSKGFAKVVAIVIIVLLVLSSLIMVIPAFG